MNYIADGIRDAISLIMSFDMEIMGIVWLSLVVSVSSVIIASVLGIPYGIFLGLPKFPGRKVLVNINYAFMGLPPVVIGLFVFILLSKKGPLGSLGILFTPLAMIIAQVILVFPIVSGLVYAVVKNNGREIVDTCRTLGGSWKDVGLSLIWELRKTLMISITTGFGRAISEVGAVMIVGGNIKNSTRVMTTFIALNNSMGDYSKSIAMGLTLLAISVVVSSVVHRMAGE